MKRIPVISALLLAASCSSPPADVAILFAAEYDGAPIHCDLQAVALSDLRFYVHNIHLLDASGESLPVHLVADGLWQNDSVALIDLEDGQGSCTNGSALVNKEIRGRFAGTAIHGIRFEIGVPQNLNHADPLLAVPPLERTPMHWHWRSGYKFIRAGIASDEGGFWMHLGSSRCQGTIGDIQGCKSPNRPVVELEDFDPLRHRIVLDLGRLFAAADMAESGSCSSGPDESACVAPFASLGLDFESGATRDVADVFRVKPR